MCTKFQAPSSEHAMTRSGRTKRRMSSWALARMSEGAHPERRAQRAMVHERARAVTRSSVDANSSASSHEARHLIARCMDRARRNRARWPSDREEGGRAMSVASARPARARESRREASGPARRSMIGAGDAGGSRGTRMQRCPEARSSWARAWRRVDLPLPLGPVRSVIRACGRCASSPRSEEQGIARCGGSLLPRESEMPRAAQAFRSVSPGARGTSTTRSGNAGHGRGARAVERPGIIAPSRLIPNRRPPARHRGGSGRCGGRGGGPGRLRVWSGR